MKPTTVLLTIIVSVIGTLLALSEWERSPSTQPAAVQPGKAIVTPIPSSSPSPSPTPSPTPFPATQNIKTPSNLEQQIAELNKRLAATEAQLASLHKVVQAQEQDATAAARDVNSAALAAVTDDKFQQEQQQEQQQQSAEERFETFVGQLQIESPDDGWTNSIENSLHESPVAELAGDLQVSGIDCRTTLCQASVEINTESVALLPHLLGAAGAKESMVYSTDTPGQYRVILKR